MTKYILVGGYIHKAQDGGKAFCEEIVKDFTHKPVKILDCIFARPRDAWEETLKKDELFFSQYVADFTFEMADPDKFTEQVENSDVIFFQGGVPHQLMSILSRNEGWGKKLTDKVVAGTSGGADTLCRYYGVGKTLNIGKGLNLLPIKFIPHWKSDYGQGLEIDWDNLLKNLQNYKEDLEIITLAEGEFKIMYR